MAHNNNHNYMILKLRKSVSLNYRRKYSSKVLVKRVNDLLSVDGFNINYEKKRKK